MPLPPRPPLNRPHPRGKAPPPDRFTPRARGALLGLAVGDALGVFWHGKRPHTPGFPERAVGLREMLGKGPQNLAKGQVTDVTQLPTALATSLRILRSHDPQDVLKRYKAWRNHALRQSDWSIKSLNAEGFNAGRNTWMRDGRRTADAGILARAVPIALFFARHKEKALQAMLTEAQLTHFHPRAQLSAAAFMGALIELFTHPDALVPIERLFEAAGDMLVEGAAELMKTQSEFAIDIKAAHEAVKRSLEMAQKPDPELYGPDLHMWRNGHWVDVAFRFAFFELAQQRSFADALEDVVNRGGEAEMNGGITGALLGAHQGEEAIPEEWKTLVLEALHQKAGPLRDQYHPKQLLELLDERAP